MTYPTRQSPRPISQAIAPGFEVVLVTTLALQVEHLIWEGPGPSLATKTVGVTKAIVGPAGADVTFNWRWFYNLKVVFI